MLIRKVQQKYAALYESKPIVFRSPASINLLGEHTSYNKGMMIQAAINKEVVFAAAPNQSDIGRVYALDYDKFIEFNVDNIEKSEDVWSNYILGIIKEFRNHGLIIGGFDCVMASDIPVGAGLSFSSALMGGMGYLLNQIFQLGITPHAIANHAFNAKTNFVGSTGFFPSNLINMLAKTNHLMLSDYQSNSQEHMELDLPNCRIILFDPQENNQFGNKRLKKRISECEEGFTIIKKYFPNIQSLRDCRHDMVLKCKDELGPVLFRRCSFIINEHVRALQGIDDLKKNRLNDFGKKLYASHAELGSEYDVSSESLDFLVEVVKPYHSVLGARAMGVGSGGCTINLVKDDDLNVFVNNIQQKFKKKFRKDLLVYKFKITKATGEVNA